VTGIIRQTEISHAMIKTGITGQTGFIGTHLFNTLGLMPHIDRIPFEDETFGDEAKLADFVASCDAVVHLAALNRHHDPDLIYNTNLDLVKKLIRACEVSGSRPHILFASSTQESLDNPYGRSKQEGREMFEAWAARNAACFSAFIIPNVFGPFGQPYYNSVVATFCHQLTHGETPRIDQDSEMKLVYVAGLVSEMISRLEKVQEYRDSGHTECIRVAHTTTMTVSALLNKLEHFKGLYFDHGIMPDLGNVSDRDLFNTFLCYIDHGSFFPFHLKTHSDHRGSFTELIRLNSGGQVSFSSTRPGITRGNHFHTRKTERFAVIAGQASISIRRTGTAQIHTFHLDGSRPAFVDMPVWHTHNLTNTGQDELLTVFWINEHYVDEDSDTFFENV